MRRPAGFPLLTGAAGCLVLLATAPEASAQCPKEPVFISGRATFYYATGEGSCLYDASPGDLMVAAMNNPDYNNSEVCGECVEVEGPDGTITVRIVDRCPGCGTGDLDLSREAFALIGDTTIGPVPIRWHVVPCDVAGPIGYRFKEGSNPWWTAVQIRNHRYAIESVEYRTLIGTYVPIPRLWYNYFVDTAGLGVGPFAFRVTDVNGQVLLDEGIVHLPTSTIPGIEQFPVCDSLSTDVPPDDPVATRPRSHRLLQNYPNPWNPRTTIAYELAEAGHVVIILTDPLGREVRRLVDARQDAGVYEVEMTGEDLASGVYLCRMVVGSYIETTRLLLLR